MSPGRKERNHNFLSPRNCQGRGPENETCIATKLAGRKILGLLVKDFPKSGKGFPCGSAGEEPAYRCRRCKRSKFDSWV